MGKEVRLVEVSARIEEFGPLATLVTVTSDGSPHVGSVLVTGIDGGVEVGVGARTRDNLLNNESLTLSWIDPSSDYQLIVDGTGSIGGEAGADGLYPVSIAVDSGILHRLAARHDSGPSCQPL